MKINFIGEKSLSSFTYKLLKIFLILTCIWIALVTIGMFYDYKKGDMSIYELSSYGLSLFFTKQPDNHFIFQYYIKFLLYGIPSLIIGIYITYCLMKLFENFSKNIIFKEENFKKTKLIGILIILFALSENLSYYLSALSINNMKTNGVTFQADIYSLIVDSRYLYGLMVIIIAEIFRRAIAIKNEQDLTI